MADNQSISVDFIDRPRSQVTLDTAYTLQCKVYFDGSAQTPSAGTITVLKPGGGALATPVSGAAVTSAADPSTYTLTAGNADELGANYTARWVLTISGTVYEFIQTFDVVRYPWRNMVVQADLTPYYPDLTSLLFSGESDFQPLIERAYHKVYQMLDAKRMRPWLVLSAEDLREPVENYSLALIFNSVAKGPDDRYSALRDFHMTEVHRWFQAMNLVYDTDHSGTADGTSDTAGGVGEEGKTPLLRWRV